MNPRFALIITILVCIVAAIAGCTGTPAQPATPAPTAAPAAEVTPGAGADLVPTENDSLDAARSVFVNIEKDHLSMIHATFQGGAGLAHVKKIEVTVNRADGQVKSAPVGILMDDSASIEGTKESDRVRVYVTLDDGKTYKIYDDLVAYKPRM